VTVNDDEHRPYAEQGRNLARLRNEARLRQNQIASAFRIQPAAVSSWETGRTRPEPEKLHELDRLLGGTGEVFHLYGTPVVADGALAADVAAIRAALERVLESIAVENREMIAGIQAELAVLAQAQLAVAETVRQLTDGLLAQKTRAGRARPAQRSSTR
jgi:transcriptional regulator with XRE-family HTH domain